MSHRFAASKFLVQLKYAPDLWGNIDKRFAQQLIKKIYDDKPANRPFTDPNKQFYKDIGKHGLSMSNTYAAVFGYCMVGYHFNIDWIQLPCLIYGVYQCALAANTYNQKHEITYDRQMLRTRSRALVKRGTFEGKYLALHHAERGAMKSMVKGVTVLGLGCNPIVAALGAFNIALYYQVYTPLKRHTWLNTQAGAIVGAIPPLMGYLTNTNGEFVNIWWTIPVLTLFCWQFPHFYGLAEQRNAEYAYAGYRMLGSSSPKSAMTWSAVNILLLLCIMVWAHHLRGTKPKENNCPTAVDFEVPDYCSYKYIGGIFLALMGWYQYKWWMGTVSAAYSIFTMSTALITLVVLLTVFEQLAYEWPSYKDRLTSKYEDLRFLLYRYNVQI